MEKIKIKQTIRAVDVLFIGPVMIIAAFAPGINPALRVALLVFGLATIGYNGVNFINEYDDTGE